MKVAIVSNTSQFLLEVGLQEPILQIKRKIEHFLGVPVAAQALSISGWELVDGLDIDDYLIVTEGTKIDLAIRPTMVPPSTHHNSDKILIIVKFSSRQITMEVDGTDTVGSLKEKIHIVDGTPIKRMSLFFSGVELEEDFRNLGEYGVHESAEIIVFLKTMTRVKDEPPTRRLGIVVQTASCLLNSASIPLEMKDSSTVNELRHLLLSRKILPQDDYLFIHKQRIMRDHCSLRWHGVENEDVLYVFKGTVSR